MTESKTAVYGAIAANIGIAITKFVVAGLTGSSAMLSEGIHSTVDAGNGVLLLIGLRLSQRKATPRHPFGVGGGVSAYEGVLHILQRRPVGDPFWGYVVLASASVFEGASLAVALRAFLRQKGERPFWDALYSSKDPVAYTI